MEVFFQRDVLKSYMVIESDFYTGYDIEMFRKNKIPGFFSFETIAADGAQQYWYEISGMQMLDSYLEQKQVDYTLLERLVLQIENGLLSGKKYLLSQNNICISPDKIGICPETYDILLCYIPQQESSFSEQFRELTERILTKVDHKDKKAVEAAYAMYEVTLQENYSLGDIKKIFTKSSTDSGKEDLREKREITKEVYYKKEENKEENKEKISETEEPAFPEQKKKDIFNITDVMYKLKESAAFLEKAPWKQKKKQPVPMQISFEPEPEEKEVINPTVLLGAPMGVNGKLTYQGRKEEDDFQIKEGDFFIGSKEDSVDAFLRSPAVSRIHAKIKKEGEDYYLEDLNSKNGTWLNGELLNYKEQYKLAKNDTIRFADEEYIFS